MRVADVRALRDKYERMLALRLLHERAREDASFEEPDPRRELAELAARYPGALREIDELPLETIRARIEALLRAEESGGVEREPWMRAQSIVHELARGALAAKRWLGKRKNVTSSHRAVFLEAIDGRDLPREAAAWADDLARIARPPRGRVMDLVLDRAARELGTDLDALRALLGGGRGRSRRAARR